MDRSYGNNSSDRKYGNDPSGRSCGNDSSDRKYGNDPSGRSYGNNPMMRNSKDEPMDDDAHKPLAITGPGHADGPNVRRDQGGPPPKVFALDPLHLPDLTKALEVQLVQEVISHTMFQTQMIPTTIDILLREKGKMGVNAGRQIEDFVNTLDGIKEALNLALWGGGVRSVRVVLGNIELPRFIFSMGFPPGDDLGSASGSESSHRDPDHKRAFKTYFNNVVMNETVEVMLQSCDKAQVAVVMVEASNNLPHNSFTHHERYQPNNTGRGYLVKMDLERGPGIRDTPPQDHKSDSMIQSLYTKCRGRNDSHKENLDFEQEKALVVSKERTTCWYQINQTLKAIKV